jgi:CBS domain-containing protein
MQTVPRTEPTVGDVMRPPATTVEVKAHLAAAAYQMRRAQDTAVVITADDEGRRPLAIITEADITDAVAAGRDVNEVRLQQLIGAEPMMTEPDVGVSEAARDMLEHGIHHLPVVENDHLVGIVDISDLCRALLPGAAPGANPVAGATAG